MQLFAIGCGLVVFVYAMWRILTQDGAGSSGSDYSADDDPYE